MTSIFGRMNVHTAAAFLLICAGFSKCAPVVNDNAPAEAHAPAWWPFVNQAVIPPATQQQVPQSPEQRSERSFQSPLHSQGKFGLPPAQPQSQKALTPIQPSKGKARAQPLQPQGIVRLRPLQSEGLPELDLPELDSPPRDAVWVQPQQPERKKTRTPHQQPQENAPFAPAAPPVKTPSAQAPSPAGGASVTARGRAAAVRSEYLNLQH